MTDHYATLGVARDADAETIKAAYKRASLAAHPDRGDSHETMAAVNQAYAILSDPQLRAEYDLDDAERLILQLIRETVTNSNVRWPAQHMRDDVDSGITTMTSKLAWVIHEIDRVKTLPGRLDSSLEWDTAVAAYLVDLEDKRVGMKAHLELLRTVRERLNRYQDVL